MDNYVECALTLLYQVEDYKWNSDAVEKIPSKIETFTQRFFSRSIFNSRAKEDDKVKYFAFFF